MGGSILHCGAEFSLVRGLLLISSSSDGGNWDGSVSSFSFSSKPILLRENLRGRDKKKNRKRPLFIKYLPTLLSELTTREKEITWVTKFHFLFFIFQVIHLKTCNGIKEREEERKIHVLGTFWVGFSNILMILWNYLRHVCA